MQQPHCFHCSLGPRAGSGSKIYMYGISDICTIWLYLFRICRYMLVYTLYDQICHIFWFWYQIYKKIIIKFATLSKILKCFKFASYPSCMSLPVHRTGLPQMTRMLYTRVACITVRSTQGWVQNRWFYTRLCAEPPVLHEGCMHNRSLFTRAGCKQKR